MECHVLHAVVRVKEAVEGRPLEGDGKAVVGRRRGRVVPQRDTVFLPDLLLGRVQGLGNGFRCVPVACRAGGCAVLDRDGRFHHGQHGAVRLGRLWGRDIGAAIAGA